MKKCPYCAEEIQDEAIFCRWCRRDLPMVDPLVSKSLKEVNLSKNARQYQLSIDFYNQYEASVIIHTTSEGQEREFGEIVLFNCFTLRQLSNLGKAGIPLAYVLSSLTSGLNIKDVFNLQMRLKTIEDITQYIPLYAALGVGDIRKICSLLIPLIPLRRAGHDDEHIFSEICPRTASIVNKRTSSGEKCFNGKMELHQERVSFYLDTKGLGILGKGVNYYAPMSVILLLKYLYDQHDEGEWGTSKYQKVISKSASLCGSMYLEQKIKLFDQLVIPLIIAQQAQ